MDKEFSFLNFDLSSTAKAAPAFILEFPFEITDNYSPVLKAYWDESIKTPLNYFKAAQEKLKECNADAVSIYFNIQEPQDSEKKQVLECCRTALEEILKICTVPLMIRLSGQPQWDIELAQNLFPTLDREVIISPVQAANYEQIINCAKNTPYKHHYVLRTPIDINLTKELNILSIDKGIEPKKILIDPEMGCIGYGIDYGYSIIERLKLARETGDKMLDMPVIVCAGEESYKAKESKSNDFSASWGELEKRAKMWEISTASALIAAGANIVVMWHPECIKTVKNQYSEVLCH